LNTESIVITPHTPSIHPGQPSPVTSPEYIAIYLLTYTGWVYGTTHGAGWLAGWGTTRGRATRLLCDYSSLATKRRRNVAWRRRLLWEEINSWPLRVVNNILSLAPAGTLWAQAVSRAVWRIGTSTVCQCIRDAMFTC